MGQTPRACGSGWGTEPLGAPWKRPGPGTARLSVDISGDCSVDLSGDCWRVQNLKFQVCSLILLLSFLPGCGYHMMGTGSSLYRQDVQTVAVPVFTNRTYRRGLETELTKNIIQQLEEHSNYKVVPKERADTILEGEIYAASIAVLNSDSNTGLPQEQQYIIVVNFTWKNLRTGDILVQRRNFDQRANFVPVLGENATVGATNAIQQLGLAIVQELQAEW